VVGLEAAEQALRFDPSTARGCWLTSTEIVSRPACCASASRFSGPARPSAPDDTAHGSRFAGKINWVQLDLGIDDNHFIDPEERLRIAMARQ
jgi:hypothetical protein